MGACPLSPKFVQFVMLAVNASIMHRNSGAARHNITRAQELGAAEAELREALEISFVLGIHGHMVGSTVMSEEASKVIGCAARQWVRVSRRSRPGSLKC